jgi:hypothetical protein
VSKVMDTEGLGQPSRRHCWAEVAVAVKQVPVPPPPKGTGAGQGKAAARRPRREVGAGRSITPPCR